MTTNDRKALRRRELDAIKKLGEYASLSTTVQKTLHLLAMRFGAMSDDGFVYAKVETLATARGVSVRTMKYHLKTLVSEGLILKNPGGRTGPSTGGRPINGYVLSTVGLHESVHESLHPRLHKEVLRTAEALRAEEPLFERNGSVLTDAHMSPVESDLHEGDSARTPSLRSTDRGEPQPLAGVSAQKQPVEMIGAQARRREVYEDAFADCDDDLETFNRRWLRAHPEDADVVIWEGRAARALGLATTDNSTRKVLTI